MVLASFVHTPVEVDLVPLHRGPPCAPGAGQHQQADDVRGLLVLEPLELRRQALDLVAAQVPRALLLLVPFDASRGVVGAPPPADREADLLLSSEMTLLAA